MTLKERRAALKMTQEEVAKAIGVSGLSIWHYENGNFKPKYEAAKALAALYGCTIEEIMEGCGPGGTNA